MICSVIPAVQLKGREGYWLRRSGVRIPAMSQDLRQFERSGITLLQCFDAMSGIAASQDRFASLIADVL
jgi:hypothetical protein